MNEAEFASYEAVGQLLTHLIEQASTVTSTMILLMGIGQVCSDVTAWLDKVKAEMAAPETVQGPAGGATLQEAQADADTINSIVSKYSGIEQALHPSERDTEWGQRHLQYTDYTVETVKARVAIALNRLEQAHKKLMALVSGFVQCFV